MQFRDLHAQYKRYQDKFTSAIETVLSSTTFISGKEVTELETKLADYVGVKNCITCANGTDAMSLVMMAWNIGEGDAIFLPDFTFFSTGEIVGFHGATPIFIDVNEDTFNIDTSKLEWAIQRTIMEGQLIPKAIIAVDLFGLPANYPEIILIAKRYGLRVLEDSAQGFGGRIGGKKAGSFGDVATTSFFPSKPLGCYGDGGAIFTEDDELASVLRSLKEHGRGIDKYDNVRIGLNSRLDTLQAAILLVKLEAFMEHELEDVNRVYESYNKKLSNIVKVPRIPDNFYSSFAQYTIILEDKESRDEIQHNLLEAGIPCMIYYKKPMHRQGAFSNYIYQDKDYKITNQLCDTVLSLPMHPYLSEDDIIEICDVIRRVLIKDYHTK